MFGLRRLKKYARREGVEADTSGQGVVLREGGKPFAYADKVRGSRLHYTFLAPQTELQRAAAGAARRIGFVMDEYPLGACVSPSAMVWVSAFVGRLDGSRIRYLNLNSDNLASDAQA